MNLHTSALAVGLLVIGSRSFASDVEGVQMRLSIYPNLTTEKSDEQRHRTASRASGNATTSRSSSSSGDANQTHFNIGAGYTLDYGLHLGGNVWRETSTYRMTTTSRSSGSSAESTDEIKAKQTSTALGPTVGYVHSSGFAAYFTPFVSVATQSESSSEYSSSGYTDDRPAPDVADNSKTSGYLINAAYHFRIGHASVGPELSYIVTETKVDVTTTEYDRSSNGTLSSTRTEETGKSKNSKILPMIGMAYTL